MIINSNSITSAAQNKGAGLTTYADNRNVWTNTNASATVTSSTTSYLSYTLVTSKTINFDRFVIHGIAPTTAGIKAQLRWSVDNFNTSLGLFTPNGSSYTLTSVNLATTSQIPAGTIEFRVYYYTVSGNIFHSDTGPYTSYDATPSSYTSYGRCFSIWGAAVPSAPTATSPQYVNAGATVANLIASGESGASFKWYNVATGGTALASTATLTTGTYYVSQTVGSIESVRTAVQVYVVLANALGINTNSPTETLDVNGTLRVRSLADGADASTFNQILVIKTDGTVGKITRTGLTSNYIGTASVGTSAAQKKTITVTHNLNLSGTQNIQLTIKGQDDLGNTDVLVATVIGNTITANSFQVVIYRADGTTWTQVPTLMWSIVQ